MTLCPTCLGRDFIYSPGGYAPKLPCPTCQMQPAPQTAVPSLGKFCSTCQAIPINGYCNLAGCPTGRLRNREFWASECDVLALSEGGGNIIATASDAEIAFTIADALTKAHPALSSPPVPVGAVEITEALCLLKDAARLISPLAIWAERRDASLTGVPDVRDGLIGVEDVVPDDEVLLSAGLRSDERATVTLGDMRAVCDLAERLDAALATLQAEGEG